MLPSLTHQELIVLLGVTLAWSFYDISDDVQIKQ